jgi:hypothetical protein
VLRGVGPPCCSVLEFFTVITATTGSLTLIVAVALARRGASAPRPAEGRCGARVPRRGKYDSRKENFGLPGAIASTPCK